MEMDDVESNESLSQEEPAGFARADSTVTLPGVNAPIVPIGLQMQEWAQQPPAPISIRSSHAELIEFALRPVLQGTKLLFRINRESSAKMAPRYQVYLEGPSRFSKTFVMAAKKIKGKNGTSYGITVDKEGEVNLGRVCSNFLGTVFNLYDAGRNPFSKPKKGQTMETPLRKELACVTYQPNLFGYHGPRKMTVIGPFMHSNGSRIDVCPSEPSETLHEKFKASRTSEILVLANKQPQWNDETESYVLNFQGRVTLASVKNFQVVSDLDLDYICMQFGRISKDSFTMDVQFPFCPLQAFGIALTSLDTKIACE